MTVEPSDASEILGIDLSDESKYTTDAMGRDIMPLNVLSPKAGDHTLRVQIVETTNASEWDAQNIETRAKRRGKDGDFITHKGMYIFTQSTWCLGNQQRVPRGRCPATELWSLPVKTLALRLGRSSPKDRALVEKANKLNKGVGSAKLSTYLFNSQLHVMDEIRGELARINRRIFNA